MRIATSWEPSDFLRSHWFPATECRTVSEVQGSRGGHGRARIGCPPADAHPPARARRGRWASTRCEFCRTIRPASGWGGSVFSGQIQRTCPSGSSAAAGGYPSPPQATPSPTHPTAVGTAPAGAEGSAPGTRSVFSGGGRQSASPVHNDPLRTPLFPCRRPGSGSPGWCGFAVRPRRR